MSVINNKSFPNTSFPDNIQQLKTFSDLSEADKSNYMSYLKAIVDGNYELANTYKNNINLDCMINAYDLNVLNDTISAAQELFINAGVFNDVINNKQQEWLDKISEFRYEGVWVAPSIFSATITYATGAIVLYNNKIWKRTSKTSTTNPVPSVAGGYWEQVQKKNAMIKAYDYNNKRNIIYIATTDITSSSEPFYNSQWAPFTLIGRVGENGSGFTFNNEWNDNVSYSIGNLVIYNNNCYSSIKDSNLNHIPTSSPEWWKHEFYMGTRLIPAQPDRPTGQISGDIWFQTLE